jgi:hypothetical protein
MFHYIKLYRFLYIKQTFFNFLNATAIAYSVIHAIIRFNTFHQENLTKTSKKI